MEDDPARLDHYREALLLLRDELNGLTQTGNDSAAVVELDQSRVGRLSRMDAMQAQAMAASSKDRRQQMLQRIEAALQRIDKEDYGYCQSCETAINPKRLDFDPTVLFCIDCASRREI